MSEQPPWTRETIRAGVDVVPRRYGDDDVIGAANEIDDGTVLAAVQHVREGRRFHLGQTLSSTSPTQMWRYWKQSLLSDRALPERAFGANHQTFVEESVSGALHSGTHLDGLGHVGIGEFTYNGHRYCDVISADGLTELGAENMPAFVTRGVLLDLAALSGVDRLDSEQEIDAEALEAAQQAAGISVGRGDIVLLHTGWGALWDADPATYSHSEPGINVDAARWCAERRVSVIGADNWAVERVTGKPSGESFPVHQECIVRNGIYLLENVKTEELARSGFTQFCCIIAPVRLKGATGSMVAPIAVI